MPRLQGTTLTCACIYIYVYLGMRHVPEFCLGAFVYPQSSYRAVLGRLKNDPHPHRPRPRGGPEPGGKLCVCVWFSLSY